MKIKILEELILEGRVRIPKQCKGWVVVPYIDQKDEFARNWLEDRFYEAGYGTFQVELLSFDEKKITENRLNLELLSDRLTEAVNYLTDSDFYIPGDLVLFGYDVSGAAALVSAYEASSAWPLLSVITVNGRADLVRKLYLEGVHIPVLFIVESTNKELVALNQLAENSLDNVKLVFIEGKDQIHFHEKELEQVKEAIFSWLSELTSRPSRSLKKSLDPGGAHAP